MKFIDWKKIFEEKKLILLTKNLVPKQEIFLIGFLFN